MTVTVIGSETASHMSRSNEHHRNVNVGLLCATKHQLMSAKYGEQLEKGLNNTAAELYHCQCSTPKFTANQKSSTCTALIWHRLIIIFLSYLCQSTTDGCCLRSYRLLCIQLKHFMFTFVICFKRATFWINDVSNESAWSLLKTKTLYRLGYFALGRATSNVFKWTQVTIFLSVFSIYVCVCCMRWGSTR